MLHLKNTTLYHSSYPRITGIVFLQNLSQLVAMVLYEIHELAMNNFSKRVCDLLQPFGLSNDMDVMAIINSNLAISDGDFKVIPDFRLSLRSLHNYGGQALIPWWSVFPNMQMDTVNQLLNLATKCLFLKITSMMEEVQANDAKIRPLQQASTTTSFPCKWSSLLRAAYHSLSNTAYK
ncbi:hypothetical protein BDN67DRAFT_1017491 [Paxillus ammoniavirescens]|nr:hypothetical protein BDN67DRAFT_1017491 [Paxillus ammoniavirescens]